MNAVSFHTLGCKLNYAETAMIEREFVSRGYVVSAFEAPADVCVINTCSVTERADRECRQIVRRARRRSPDAFIVVLGCYAQLAPEAIASIDGVDLILGTSEKFDLFKLAEDFKKFDTPRVHVSPIDEATGFGPAYSGGVDDRTRAFLKVQDGCDFNCSFCTIPLARGRSRSQEIGATIRQAEELVGKGYREIVLTGVNVGDYGRKDGVSILRLLRAMENIEGLERIRVSSIEPNLLTEELLDFWLGSDVVCPHFHIPLQSGSDVLLRAMRRRYTTRQYRSLIDRIRDRSPNAGIGADVIVGFPGETEGLFREEYDFIHSLPVSYLHVFTYSERANTPSSGLSDRVEPRVRYARSTMLRTLAKKKRESFHATQIGRTVKVLFERALENNMLSGYTDNYVRVMVPNHPSLENQVVRVAIERLDAEGCTGRILESGRNAHTQDAIMAPRDAG